jgi:hypothetical protein
MEPPTLTPERASAYAKLALKGIATEYPYKPGHVLTGDADVKSPKAVHPAFYGSFDWHSAVHSHWTLVRLLRTFPKLPEADAVRTALGKHLTAENLKAEADYFAKPQAKTFERPYGWAWLLKLATELHAWDDPDAQAWAKNLKPLADLIADRYVAYFPKQTYPVRAGVHSNTAFGLGFAHDYAVAVGHEKLKKLVADRAVAYYGRDEDAPAKWEPDGADFLSPALCEADLMRRVLPPAEFRTWFAKFLPAAAKAEPKTLFAPATVTDRADPQLVHLDGLNLSRAWAMRNVAAALPAADPVRTALLDSAEKHIAAAVPHVASGDYAGEHWLASFAVYLFSTRGK